MAEDIKSQFLLHGTILFLLGLLNGTVVPFFINTRMGLSAHLAGVQNAIVLWIFGLLCSHLRLTVKPLLYFYWSSIIGMYSIWFALLLAAIWGTSRSTPIAGEGYTGSAFQEAVVQILLTAGAIVLAIATVLLLIGLLKRKTPEHSKN